MNLNKPNPYVIVQEEKEGAQSEDKKNLVYKYPKSKIFVGGLDFKLDQHALLQHFS